MSVALASVLVLLGTGIAAEPGLERQLDAGVARERGEVDRRVGGAADR